MEIIYNIFYIDEQLKLNKIKYKFLIFTLLNSYDLRSKKASTTLIFLK